MALTPGGIEHGGNVFAVAREHSWDWHDIADFSASINPLGPAPGVRRAICEAVDRITHYPEREPERLRNALAETWGVNGTEILLGNGATELIFFAARTFGDQPATLALPVFSEFHRAFPEARCVALRDTRNWPTAGLLVLTRPANPTGETLGLDELEPWLAQTGNPVLIDESFLEFSAQTSAAALLNRRPGLFVLRSLTKFYALPGLRIGALLGSAETWAAWRRHREPWQVNVLAEQAALAAVADKEHAAQSLAFVRSERDWLRNELSALPGVAPLDSDANFLYVRLGYPAAGLCRHLLAAKVLVRDCAGWPGLAGEAVRVAIRPREENERLLAAWRSFSCA